MNTCPRCRKSYDESYKICLTCSIPLLTADPVVRKALQEVEDIRKNMLALISRVNALEQNLLATRTSAIPIPTPKPAGAPVTAHAGTGEEKKRVPLWQPAARQEAPRAATPPPARKPLTENIEEILGEKWFNKLGVMAVVVGVAMLIGYSFRYLGPVAKIAIGYLCAAGLLGFGTFIEKKKGFAVYGRTIIGGGWAIAYFTTYAMHHIPLVCLIDSPVVGMGLLLAVAVATVAHTYRYRSQVATAFAYLLIFITLMINPLTNYTVFATLVVALSLLFFMYKLGWNEFGVYGMTMTYLTFMAVGRQPANEKEFFLALGMLVLHWTIFVLASFVMKERPLVQRPTDSGTIMAYPRELTLILNTGFACSMGWSLLTNGYMQYLSQALALAAGLYALLSAVTFARRQRLLCNVGSTFAVLFALAYLAQHYSGYSLTVAYILLAQVVLLLGIVLRQSYWRILAFCLLTALLVKLLLLDAFYGVPRVVTGRITTRLVLFGIAFVVYLGNYLLYEFLKKRGRIEPFERDYPVILSYMYPAIYAMGTWLDLPKVLTAPCWVLLGVFLLQMGLRRDNYHQRIQGYILTGGAFVRLLMSNLTISGGINGLSYRMLTAVPVLMLLQHCALSLRDSGGGRRVRPDESGNDVLYDYLVCAGLLLVARYEAAPLAVAAVWSGIAMVYALAGLRLKLPQFLTLCSLAAIAAAVRAVFTNIVQPRYLVGREIDIAYLTFTIVSLYIVNLLYFSAPERLTQVPMAGLGMVRRFLRSPRLVFSLMATGVLTTLLIARLSGVSLTIGLGIEGLLLFLAGFGIKERNWRLYGLFILLATLVKAFLVDLRQLSTLYYILSLIALGLALLFVSYMYTKHKDAIKKFI